MSEYLYVCHFSNGHIKVGRSIHPKSRIASHADRVVCVGIELVEHHIFECIGFSTQAERELIDRCAHASTKRSKNEWFHDLDYQTVCDWAAEIAETVFEPIEPKERREIKENGALEKAIEIAGGLSALSRLLDLSGYAVIQQWRRNRVPAERCPAIERATNGKIRCEDLRPDVAWAVLRDSEKATA